MAAKIDKTSSSANYPTEVANPKLIVIAAGFYYFGDLIEPLQEGYISIKSGAMFGGEFGGGKGLPGVARGDSSATVTLDRFAPDEILNFPESACYGILPSINLYEFSGTKIR